MLIESPPPQTTDVDAAPGASSPERDRASRAGQAWALAVSIGPWALPTLVMLIVGRYQLRKPTLGWDELATLVAADRPAHGVIDLARQFDGVLLPYYLFMHYWTGVFGTSELAMRAPSLLCVAAAAGLAGYLGRRLIGPLGGLVAGLLIATIPQVNRYAQEARPYGFVLLFATLALLLLLRAVDRPTSWWRWAAYAAAVAATGLFQMFALLLLAGHGVYVLVKARGGPRELVVRWLIAAAAGTAIVLPLIYVGMKQQDAQMHWLQAPTRSTYMSLPQTVFASAAVCGVILGAALTARRLDKGVLPLLAVSAVVPPVGLLLLSFYTPAWVPRYVLFTMVPWCLLAAAAVRKVPGRAAILLALAAAVSIQGQIQVRIPYAHTGANYRAVDVLMRQYHQPGDVILYGPETTWALRNGVNYYVPTTYRPKDVLSVRPAREIDSLVDKECADKVACFGDPEQVWLMRYNRVNMRDNMGALTPVLEKRYHEVGRWRWGLIFLVRLERNDNP